jgi:hypothetical protein
VFPDSDIDSNVLDGTKMKNHLHNSFFPKGLYSEIKAPKIVYIEGRLTNNPSYISLSIQIANYFASAPSTLVVGLDVDDGWHMSSINNTNIWYSSFSPSGGNLVITVTDPVSGRGMRYEGPQPSNNSSIAPPANGVNGDGFTYIEP